ncbi:MAG: PAS domain S-box protein, partial [Armatimonadia bacterium]|nr:PAS domain S-box protein [Armatimonadia bacterium]
MAATRTALRFAVALMIAAIACLTGAPASAEDDAPEVLVLHSYHSGLSWTDGVTDGLREVLQDAGELTLCLEYMDSKRHPVDEVEEPLVELLRARYSGAPPSVVVVVDNNALDLIKRRREELFPGTPIVFCGINHFGPELIDDSGYYTGVVEQTDAARTFAAMRGLLPDLERCIVIGDRTATGQAEIRAAQEALGGEYEGVKVEYWRDLTLAQILGRLPVLRAGEDAVLLTVLNRDASGQFFTYEESGRQICQASPVPVFGLWDFYLDTGVVGGRMASAPDQGRAAGQLVLRILAGRRPAELPIVGDSPNRDIFDYRAMARHGLSEDDLPAGSTLINKPTARDRRLWMAAYWALGFAGLVIVGSGLASWVSARRGRKRSRFSREIARATVLLPVLAAAFGSGLWMAQDYVGFNAEVADLRERLTQECREEVKQQVDQAMEHVAYERAEEDKHLRQELLLRTEQAHRLAEHLCAEHADEPLARRQELVEEALTAMRWDDGEGYYFAIDTDGVAWVYPPSPEIEGEIIRGFADQYSEGMVDKMIHAASVHGQGFVEYLWPRIDGAEPSTKFAHVRYLEPLGWIIGTGMYMEDLTAHTQEMVRDRLAAMSFADGEGYIFVKSFDGTELVNRAQPHLVGQNLWEMEDAEGSKVVQEIVQAAYDPDGAYVTYSWVAPGRDEPTPKLSYVRGVTDWGWAVGAGLHLDRIEGAVADKRETMRAEFVVRLVLMLLSSSIVAAACAWIGRRAGGALAGEFDRFHRAFADSLARRRPIDRESFLYSEFRALADGVNGNVQRLRDSEQRLAATLNSIGDGVVCTDAQGRVTRLNPIAESLTGWSGDEAQGRPVETVFRIFHGATGETAANPVLQAMAEGRIFELANNTVLVRRDGTSRQIADSAAPIRDVDGTVVGGVLVFRDVTAEYRMREAVRASEELHRSLFEGSPNCVILCEADGRIVTINAHGAAALGLDEEVAGRRFLDLWPEAGRAEVERGIDRVLAADMPNFEAGYLRPDGETLEWLCALSPVTDADGQVRHFIAVLTDITDRVRGEEALEQSREQFMLAVRGSQDGIWDWDLRDNSLFLSARWKEQIGYQDHEMPNTFESFAERLHPEDAERVMRTVQEYLAGDLPRYQTEFRLRHKDGSYQWILARGEAIRGEDGTPFRMAGSHTDITPLKAAEEALAEGRDRLERILGAVQSCVMLIDSETHNVLEVNKAACQAIGLPREEIVGRLCHQFVCPAEKGRCPITDLCQTVDNSERVLVNADGDHTPILKTVCEVEIDGRPCLVESFVDISHQKHQEEALREALQEAEDLNRRLEQQTMAANELAIQAEEASLAKSRFLANMSHEIRTPMNGVIGMTGLLLDTSLTPDQRSYAETVGTSANALLDLLNDILDFSKIEAGRLELRPAETDLPALLAGVADLLAPRARVAGLDIVLV